MLLIIAAFVKAVHITPGTIIKRMFTRSLSTSDCSKKLPCGILILYTQLEQPAKELNVRATISQREKVFNDCIVSCDPYFL